VRQYGAHGMRNLSADVDEYGLDPHVEEQARPWLETLCTRYFRLTLEGAERIPRRVARSWSRTARDRCRGMA
jgi:hypothetical protein